MLLTFIRKTRGDVRTDWLPALVVFVMLVLASAGTVQSVLVRNGAARVLGEKRRLLVLAAHHSDIDKLHLIGGLFLAERDAHANGIGKGCDVVDFHGFRLRDELSIYQ